jgi:serine/threonine protein kinase
MIEESLLNDRYIIEETLGKGGMAVVYKARDTTLERTVAIKVLRREYSENEAFREHFRQEAKAAANLTHPNIVTVHDFGFDNDRIFIIMEYVPGTDLKELLEKSGRLSIDESLKFMIQACAGVGFAHRTGLVHCDIKPQNLLITPDQQVKVVDFGIARALASINPQERSEIVWGSPHYFSPEQAAGMAPSLASDVYSLGVIMYEMLIGKPPFRAQEAAGLAKMHREQLPPAPQQLNPEIPPELQEILLKVLSKVPAARYRNADQFGRVLRTYRESVRVPDGLSPPSYGAAAMSASQTEPYEPPSGQGSVQRPAQAKNPLEIDWITIALALLALITVGGLIPFYLWVYFVYNPPIR